MSLSYIFYGIHHIHALIVKFRNISTDALYYSVKFLQLKH